MRDGKELHSVDCLIGVVFTNHQKYGPFGLVMFGGFAFDTGSIYGFSGPFGLRSMSGGSEHAIALGYKDHAYAPGPAIASGSQLVCRSFRCPSLLLRQMLDEFC